MKTPKTLLLVEDSRRQYLGLRGELEDAGWQIIHVEDGEQALYTYHNSSKAGQPPDAVAIDLGLPPIPDFPLKSGVPLAKKLRHQDDELPILAYTSRSPTDNVPFDRIIAELLPLRISFIFLRKMEKVDVSHLLELVWQGFVLLSPGTADFLPQAVPDKPDPLTEQLWETLARLAEGKSYREIALELDNVGLDGVRARMNKIRELLIETGELTEYQRQREDLVDWYKRQHTRYRR